MSAEGQRCEEVQRSSSQSAGDVSSNSQLGGWDDSNLHPAAMFDNAELLECLLEGDAKKHINNTDFSHRTPVYTAVLNNSFRALKVLLDHGANPNIAGDATTGYMTPLHLAVANNKMEAVKLLVKKANLDLKNGEGFTPLGIAVSTGNNQLIEMITSEMVSRVQKHHQLIEVLRSACEKGDLVEVARVLTLEQEEGILAQAINNTSGNLYTPLSLASRYGHVDVARFLIEQGANVTPQPLTNETPLHIASEFGHTEVVFHLLETFRGVASMLTTDHELPIHIAAQKGNEELVRLLLTFPYPKAFLETCRHQRRVYKAPFDINTKDMREMTPLLYAVEKGHIEIVKYLVLEHEVSSKPDPEAEPDQNSQRNKDAAGMSTSFSMSSSFIRRNKQSLGRSFSRRRQPQVDPADGMVNICPVDLEAVDQEGRNALFIAMQQDSHSMVEVILKAGANLNTVWSDGQYSFSPLMMAAKRRNLSMVNLLLSYGARDDENHVLDFAMRADYDDLMAALLRQKCRKDMDNSINKKSVFSKYQRLHESNLGENFCSMDYESMAIFPSTPVAVEWQNLGKLERIEESWITCAVNQIHPLSPHTSLDSNFTLFAVTKIDVSGNNIRILPRFLFRLPSLQLLDVSNNNISNIQTDADNQGKEDDCPYLTKIFLHHNALSAIPEFIFTLGSLSILDLSFNNIHSLPSVMWMSQSLTEVNLSHNRLRSLPMLIKEQMEVFSKNSSTPSIHDLMNGSKFTPGSQRTNENGSSSNSELMDETNCKVRLDEDDVFPQTEVVDTEPNHDVYWLTHINVVKQRPQSEKGIEVLNLANNQFSRVPSGLPCLVPHLTQLDLSGNQLTCVGFANWYPASLNQLILNNNNIRSIPPDDDTSEASHTAYCYKWVNDSGRPRTPDKRPRLTSTSSSSSLTLRPQMGTCHHRQHSKYISLEELNLAQNKLTSLQLLIPANSSVARLSKVEPERSPSKTLDGRSDINLIFPSLTALDVASNQIRVLPAAIGEMTTLKSLNLSYNSIRDLPPDMGLLKKLWQLNLENCPLEGPLREMIETKCRPAEIISFLDSIREESTEYNCMNLIFVGQHDIGKTSLLQLMRKEGKSPRSGMIPKALHWTERTSKNGIKPKQKKGSKLLSTVGIDINELVLEKRGKEVTFRTWDFGGQREYYATHQYFLSTRALYLVVWNMVGKSGMKSIWEWLVNIQARAPGSAVIIVGTHLDVLKDKKTASLYPDDYEKEMMEKLEEIKCMVEPEKYGLPNVLHIRNVSCKTEENIRDLVSTVYNCAFQLKHPRVKTQHLLGQKIPRKYLLLQKIVTDLAQERKADQRDPVIDANLYKVSVMNQMTEVCGEVFRDMAELDQATRFLHENGVLCHYEDSSLRDLYFLDPQWLCDQLARVVSIPDVNRYAHNGVMKVSDLELSFKDTTYKPQDIRKYFINLLEKFEVALQFDSQNLLIPSMLASEHDPKQWIKIPVRKKSQEYVSIRQRKRQTYLTDVDETPIMNIGNSKFYIGKVPKTERYSLQADQVSQHVITESVEITPEISLSQLKFSAYPAFSLHRLYFMTYFPSGFWPRLIIGLLADTGIYDILSEMYQPSEELPGLRSILENTPEWRCWKTGIDLVYLGNQVLCVKEFNTDHPGGSCDYGQCKLMCPQEGDLRPISLEKSSLLEITIANFSVVVPSEDGVNSGSSPSPRLVIHQDFKVTSKLLTQVVDRIDTLLHDWFPDLGELRMAQSMDGRYLITRVVPCSKCINSQMKRDYKNKKRREGLEWSVVEGTQEDVESTWSLRVDSVRPKWRSSSLNAYLEETRSLSRTPGADEAYCRTDPQLRLNCVYTFMVEEYILAAKRGKHISCPQHGAVSPLLVMGPQHGPVQFHLAPDLVFADLPEELLIREDRVHVGAYLGHGAFGFVFAGELNQGESYEAAVALKMLEPFDSGLELDEELSRRLQNQKRRWQEDPMQQCTEAYLMARQELGILQVTQHEHIIPFMGIALSPLSLVLALAPMGSLDKLLRKSLKAQERLPVHVITHVAYQVASALKYLHSQRIIYRDLKSENALVFSFPTEEVPDDHIVVKLSDYGISRSIHASGAKGFGGTPPFIAPEVIQQGGKTTYSEKVDCFSFGMFLYELLTCETPFCGHPMIININLHVFQGGRPSISPEITRYPAYMLDLMTSCWAQEAKHRPSSEEIVDIVCSPEFSHMADAVNLEGNVAVSAACSLQLPSRAFPDDFSESFGSIGTDVSYGGAKKGDNLSQLWLITRTKLKGAGGTECSNLEIFTYQQNRCEESQVVRLNCLITTMAVVNSLVWCVDSRANVHIYCPSTLQKLCQFELSPFKEPSSAVAVLHAALRGDVIIVLSNGHLLVYPDQFPLSSSEFLPQKEDIFCNGRRIHCAVLLHTGDSNYEVWAGQDHGKIAIQTLGSHKSPGEISAVKPEDPNICTLFLVTDAVQMDSAHVNPSVWAYNYPGSVVYHWTRSSMHGTPLVDAILDCSLLYPDTCVTSPSHRLESVWCQVTAMNVLSDYLYVGTTSGSIIVANKMSMEPLHCFRCHANKEFYIKFLIPLCNELPGEKTSEEQRVVSPGIISVGKGFQNIFDKVKERRSSGNQLDHSTPVLPLDEVVSKNQIKEYRPRQDNTYLLTWIAEDWEDNLLGFV